MKVHAILLAGGSSDRFNNEENKVYFPIGGKPALSWALETLDQSEKVDSILLVVRDEDWDKTRYVVVCDGSYRRFLDNQAKHSAKSV